MLYSCNKKKDSNTSGSDAKHSVTYLHEIQISQYVDTIIAIPILPENPGGSAPVAVTFNGHPDWITVTPLPISTTPGSFASFALRFRPYSAGTYPVQFTVKWSSSDSQSYSFNVIVNELPDCVTYLAGNYKILSSNVPSYFDQNATGIVASDSVITYPPIHTPYFIKIVGLNMVIYAHLNCADKTINITPQYMNSDTYQGTGTFSNDSVFLRIIRSRMQPMEVDTSDLVMIRK